MKRTTHYHTIFRSADGDTYESMRDAETPLCDGNPDRQFWRVALGYLAAVFALGAVLGVVM